MNHQKGRVVLIGAGPGDPELLTLKGDKVLREADVVLYDALVDVGMLERCRPDCKRVYVGKRKGNASISQEHINRLILWHAEREPLVVRLKGGDPFVFGRGHEEASFLARFGIQAEIIPGISSALAAPALAGISVTQRGVNESFWVITGTLSDGALSNDMIHAAQSSATLIVLMGLGKLSEIAQIITTYRSPLEPMAIVEHASTPGHREIFSVACNITAAAEGHQVTGPAVIIIGNVVENTLHALTPIFSKYQL